MPGMVKKFVSLFIRPQTEEERRMPPAFLPNFFFGVLSFFIVNMGVNYFFFRVYPKTQEHWVVCILASVFAGVVSALGNWLRFFLDNHAARK